MPQEIIFDVLHEYDTLETGIVVPATLKSGENFVDLKAKVERAQHSAFLSAFTACA